MNLVLAATISLFKKPRPEKELIGLVCSLTPKPVEHHMAWYARPSAIAVALLAMGICLNLSFR
ncbi:MAG TPA: hypothetical protein VME18_11140 [Acidobacteriaceae bacterium]|nr:hypothetical protein [Acidobacteriaceae bacterium]